MYNTKRNNPCDSVFFRRLYFTCPNIVLPKQMYQPKQTNIVLTVPISLILLNLRELHAPNTKMAREINPIKDPVKFDSPSFCATPFQASIAVLSNIIYHSWVELEPAEDYAY